MRTYIVLGVPRGGTSMIAGLLRIFGVNMGDNVNEDKHEDLTMDGLTRNELIEYIFERNKKFDEEEKSWGFKSPWIGHFLDDIKNFFANPHYIWVTRDLTACLNSDIRHTPSFKDRLEPESYVWHRNLHLIKNMDRVVKYSNAPLLRISYEESLKDPKGLVEKMEKFIGIKLDEKTKEKAIKFISPGYKSVK